MVFDDNILGSHRALSDCNAQFLCFIRDNPEYLNRSHYKTLVKNPEWGSNSEYNVQPWPTFVNERTKNRIAGAALKVQKLIALIPEKLFSYDCQKISAYYEVSVNSLKSLMGGVNTDLLLSGLGRGDFMLTPNGEFKCIEFNLTTNVAGWWTEFMEPKYLNVPAIKSFLRQNEIRYHRNRLFEILFSYILRSSHLEAFKNNEKVNLAIAVPNPERLHSISCYLNKLYQRTLHLLDSRLKGSLSICTANDLTLASDTLEISGTKIHMLVDMCSGGQPISWFTLVKSKRLHLYNIPASVIMSNKLNLALLSEYQESDLFTYEERQDIASHVPWTRKTVHGMTNYRTKRVQLEDFALRNREILVLKHTLQLGGKDVYIGAHTANEEWKQKVKKAFDEKKWILQEFVPSQSYYYQTGSAGFAPHHVIWGPFVFGGNYAGAWARVAPVGSLQGVINGSRGAEESTIIEIDER